MWVSPSIPFLSSLSIACLGTTNDVGEEGAEALGVSRELDGARGCCTPRIAQRRAEEGRQTYEGACRLMEEGVRMYDIMYA